MQRNYDIKTGKYVIEISEDEIIRLNDIKEIFRTELNDFTENERLEDDLGLSGYVTNKSKRSYLGSLRHHLIHDLAYNDDFENVVYFKNGFIEFNNQKFLEFASAFNILDDESKGLRTLQNIVRVQIIDWTIDNYYLEDDERHTQFKLHQNISTSTIKEVPDIFKDDGIKELFHYCLQNGRFDKMKRKNINGLYSWFKKYMNCSILLFAQYWNDLNMGYVIKFYSNGACSLKNDSDVDLDKDLDALEYDFNQNK